MPYMNNLEVEIKIEDCEIHLKQNPKSTRRKSVKRDSDDEYIPPSKKKKKPISRTPKKQLLEKQVKKVYTCRKCYKEFETRKALYDHNKTHDDEEKGIDKHTFKYDENLEIFFCNTCSAEFQKKEEVEEHISKIHEELYTCEVCQQVSKTAYNFALHMKRHSESDTLSCPLCNYTTTRRTCLQTHINRVHYHKFYYYCKTCGKGFNDSAIFKEHNNEHLGIKAFVCVVCNKEFMFSRYLNLHQTRYHTVHIEGTLHRNQCSICLKVFSKVDTLLKHITTKHNKNPDRVRKHLCDICGNSFGSRDKLKIHYRVHTGDKPYSCSYCDKSFTKKDYLVMHERVHTGEKPYSCRYCGKCFNQAASLRIHVRGHTGERPYICQLCNGGYISRGSLNLHLKICNGGSSD